jgi:hypothetical protein
VRLALFAGGLVPIQSGGIFSMSEPQLTLRSIAWRELFPWLILFRSVRIALMARVLLLGASGLLVTIIGWQVLGAAFSKLDDQVIHEWTQDANHWLWGPFNFSASARNSREVFESASRNLEQAPVEVWLFMTLPFRNLFDGRLSAAGFLCMFLACVWELVVWGIFGGAISRIAALKFTRDDTPSLTGALRHSVGKIPSYGVAPLVALAGAAVFAIQLVVVGALMNVGFLALLAAIIWPFVLLLGLLMAILLLGALVGWPLMWATVAVEGTDAFDALSRGYAYTYQRPWRLLWYVVFAFFLAAVSMFVVKAFAISAIALGNWSIGWGLRDEEMSQLIPQREGRTELSIAPPILPPAQPDDGPLFPDVPPGEVAPPEAGEPTGMRWTARKCIEFWQAMWKTLAAGYQAGFIWVAGVGIYLLLRRDIDGAEMDEVYVGEEDEHGLPVLEDDASSGVPEVAPERPAQPADAGQPPTSP